MKTKETIKKTVMAACCLLPPGRVEGGRRVEGGHGNRPRPDGRRRTGGRRARARARAGGRRPHLYIPQRLTIPQGISGNF